MKDEHAIVLDYLEHGRPGGPSKPVAQVVGTENFNLLEVVPQEDVRLNAGDEVYIGEGDRDEVRYIKGKITTHELTQTAKSELEYVLEDLVEENEDDFVEFFNEAEPLTPRQHALELLPSIGEKHMWEILDERDDNGDFASLDDIKERVDLLPDPRGILVKRLMQELSGDEKHYLFTVPPKDRD
ncbi:MAG: DUF655 domain-containing protein [Candidatus Nanohaloarchaea archaeon]|nr:DUF655 domain-containing protein [Candidatus Nanohaloarchaea archaeon]